MSWFDRLLSGPVEPRAASITKRSTCPDEVARPGRPAWMNQLDHFIGALQRRLRSGQREYGDKSFSADPLTLVREVQEELEDVCGWSFVLWHRLEAAKQALQGVPPLPPREEEVVL